MSLGAGFEVQKLYAISSLSSLFCVCNSRCEFSPSAPAVMYAASWHTFLLQQTFIHLEPYTIALVMVFYHNNRKITNIELHINKDVIKVRKLITRLDASSHNT